MKDVTMIDKTGSISSIQDVQEATRASQQLIVKGMILLPPEIATYLPLIHRCLKEYLALRHAYPIEGEDV